MVRQAAACAMLMILLASCGPSSAPPSYDAAIREGRSAAQELLDGGASAVTIALVDGKNVVWSEAFGLADRDAGEAPTRTTTFGVGSVSKMFAAVAVMTLVDRGVVDLDTPLVEYLPDFRMASDGYEDVTVRMLLDHSSGFPGTDYRNADIRSPAPGYLDQVLQTLSTSRLKAPPGSMSVYCNDGFTVVAALVEAVTGSRYVQFVQDEILTPLGMANTRYPLGAFAAGSYARAYASGAAKPQEFVNTLGAGALYSTADDLARLAMMFLGDGAIGNTRILSAAAVAEMAVDRTIGSFNPVHNGSFAYGLGWDTVVQPGLAAVGFDGWAKGGDSDDYGAALVVSPQAQLGIAVISASYGGSAGAIAVAERVLLRALVESGRIATFPAPLEPVVPPVAPVPDGLLAAVEGIYAQGSLVVQLSAQPDGSLQAALRSDEGWTPSGFPLRYRDDGWFASDQDPLRAFKVVDADLLGEPTQYLLDRLPAGHGHYLESSVFAQRVLPRSRDLSAAWRDRLSSTWLVVNASPDELAWNGMDPRLRLAAVPDLDGLVAVRPPSDVPAPAAGQIDARFHLVDPSASDTTATMMLVIPQLRGRDLDDLDVEQRDDAEWVRFGSYVHQPIATVPVLRAGASGRVTIGGDGYAAWRAIESEDASTVEVEITTTGAWQLYDPTFTRLANGKGNAVASLPAGSGLGYLTLFGDPSATITVAVRCSRAPGAHEGSVVDSFAGEDPGNALRDARGSRLRLLRAREVEHVGPPPARRQRVEGLRELAILLQHARQLLRQCELALRLEVDGEPGLLHRDRLLRVGLHHRLLDLRLAAELEAQRRLRVLALAAQQPVRVLEQRALEEHQGAVLLERLDDGDVGAREEEARLAPLEVLVETGLEEDRPQLPDLAAPRLRTADERIDLGTLRAHRTAEDRGADDARQAW